MEARTYELMRMLEDEHWWFRGRRRIIRKLLQDLRLSENSRILEIGCGTAQATLPFAERGYAIHCIELGANLAAIAKRKLSAYPKVQVSVGNLENIH